MGGLRTLTPDDATLRNGVGYFIHEPPALIPCLPARGSGTETEKSVGYKTPPECLKQSTPNQKLGAGPGLPP